MLYDRRDFGLLRLAGAYQWLPLAPLRALSPLKQLFHEAELLVSLRCFACVGTSASGNREVHLSELTASASPRRNAGLSPGGRGEPRKN